MSVQVPKGYKQTEVGVIPCDWSIESIGGVSRKIMDFRGRTPKKLGLDWGGGDIPALSAGNVKMGYIDFSQECYLGSEDLYKKWMVHGDVKKGDIVFTSEAPLGNVALIPDEKKYILSQRVVLLQVDLSKINNEFVYHFLKSDKFQKNLQENASGSTAKGIKRKVFEKLLIASPPLPEQQAIAEALSDADALIESLEQLIAKKRQIKQGAIQELLTGKRRLPGFSGEWEVKKIDEIADCLDYLRIPINDSERRKIQGDYPYCGANGILDYIDKYCIDDDVVLIAEDGGYFDEYATRPIAYRMKGKFWVNNHVHILKSKSNFDQLYLYYSLVHKNILPFLASGTRAKLNKSEMSKITIHQPINKVEQTAIASILSDIDSEIASLDSRLAKARKIKQSMMQELLTGRIRLI